MMALVPAPIADFRVPDDLTERDQWVLWRFETLRGKQAKVPYETSGNRADSTEPATWTTFEEVLNTWRSKQQVYTGIGFVFSNADPFCGVDLDDCLDAEGDLRPWACGIVERFGDSYQEISPSGEGLKIWVRGSLPANLPGVKVVGGGQVELYDHSRYFTVTGQVFRGAPLEIEDHARDLLTLYERFAAGRKSWTLQPLVGGRIPYGQQHNTLVSIAGTLRARRLCEEAIRACLLAVNRYQCEKPGPSENIEQIVSSSRNWGAR
jgi:primase-polymerase (primpol)-like protein